MSVLKRHSTSFEGSCLGFTLLEVMVALTITGLALGGIFSVIGSNKQLAWRSESVLVDVSHVRALVNLSQLLDERGDLFINLNNQDYQLNNEGRLPEPERKTQVSQYSLSQYELVDNAGETITMGSRWVELSFPE